jgi:hypothetical protein
MTPIRFNFISVTGDPNYFIRFKSINVPTKWIDYYSDLAKIFNYVIDTKYDSIVTIYF